MNHIPIHGKVYDLRHFNHPGGNEILELCKNETDCTALFESYHSLSDMTKIKALMKKYEIGESKKPTLFSFKQDGFYSTVKKRVSTHLRRHTKWTYDYLGTVALALGIFGSSQYCVFTSSNSILKGIMSIVSGCSIISLGFNILHDGSHYAISHSPKINHILSYGVYIPMIWNRTLWSFHHIIKHHQYTGMIEYDPDIIHLRPYFRKTKKLQPYKNELRNPHIAFKYLAYNLLLPGTETGQAYAYTRWIFKQRLWRMSLPNSFYSVSNYLQYSLSLLYIIGYIYYSGFTNFYLYVFGMNLTYWIGISPDHDMYATHKQIESSEGISDWGEMQVRHAGNFMSGYPLFTRWMGGINYQIEHHLFPSLSNHRLKDISPIVKKTCKEFDIPYVSVESPKEVLQQVLKTYEDVQNE